MSADEVHARHDIGECGALEAESIGPPGGRRFRVRASAERGSALLWLEKEELAELARAIKSLLRTSVRPSFVPQPPTPDDSVTDFEFKVHSLAIGHDAQSDRYMLLAQVSEQEGDAIVMWADRATLDQFADQAFEVHDAGRPSCPLCGSPITEGRRHVCPRAN